MIKEHIEAIQREIKERFGVNADINIHIHSVTQTIDLEKATEITCALQPDFEGVLIPNSGDTSRWINISNCPNRKDFAVFYEVV